MDEACICAALLEETLSAEGLSLTPLSRMKKRRAESDSSCCSVPGKKRRGSVCNTDSPPASSPPQELQCTASLNSPPRSRKRPGPEPLCSLPEPKKAPAARCAPLQSTADSSGKFCGRTAARERPRVREKPLKTDTMENNNRVIDSGNISEDDLNAFNSFQFWRVPLPELDLSLLERQVDKDTAPRDGSEAMET